MALTPEELRQRIPNWSLESDGQLLQYMISIGKNIQDRCTQTTDSLNALMLQVNRTEVKLANATNQFSAVEQVKFVENRVEEDDESFYGLRRRRQQQPGEEPDKQTGHTDDGGERSLDDLLQLAVERSIEGVYRSYEKVTLELSDSETSDDDEPSPTTGKPTVMRAIPRYAFIERPLPHVIGTKEWQGKWHVGLIDSDDESSSERKEEYSESPSETDDGGMFPSQPNSKNHTPSESECSIWGPEGIGRKRAPSMDPSITGDDGSSVYSYASSSKVVRPLPGSHPVRGMAPEAARLKPPSLFPEELPPEDDGHRRKGLFDDSPDEGEPVPFPTPQPRQTDGLNNATKPFFKGTIQQTTRKVVNLFDDEPPEPTVAPAEQKKPINLFIESDDEPEAKVDERNNNPVVDATDRDRETGSVKPASRPSLTKPRKMTALVDELNNNFRKQRDEPPENVPEVTNHHHGGHPASMPVSDKRSPVVTNLFDDEPPADEFDRLFSASKTAPMRPAEPKNVPPPTKRTVNLFVDDEEDDYDDIVVGSNEIHPPSVRDTYSSPNRLQLPKPANRMPTVKKKSIFDDSDSEDDAESLLFGGQNPSVLPQPAAEVIPKATPKTVKSIFSDSSDAEGDDDEALLFGKSTVRVNDKLDVMKRIGVLATQPVADHSKTVEGKPTPSRPLFDPEPVSDQPSANGEDVSRNSAKKPDPLRMPGDAVKANAVSGVSLFDDEPPSDDEALFTGGHRSNAVPASIHAPVVNVKQSPSADDAAVAEVPATTDNMPSNTGEPAEKPKLFDNEARTAAASIRSAIMKKSIFNSDTESDEDDSIFGAGLKNVKQPAKPPHETASNRNGSRELEEQDVQNDHAVSSNSEPDKSIAEDANLPTLDMIPTITEKDSVKLKTSNETSIFDDSPPEDALGNDPFTIEISEPAEIDANTDSNHPNNGMIIDRETSSASNDTAHGHEKSVNESVGHDNEFDPSLKITEEDSLPDEPTAGVMIANDIDYYLRTNELPRTPENVVKSEPKGALNFSPIGLFDDVPPPDDDGNANDDDDDGGGATYDIEHPEPTIDSGEPPPSGDTFADEPSDTYATESQSLNFIPTEKGTTNRSRYLFDDEPPPDEADHSSAFSVDNNNPIGKRVSVERFRDTHAPASLPTMVVNEDSRKPVPKVNKLNTRIAINVAALLPGARRPTTTVSSEKANHSPSAQPAVDPSVLRRDVIVPQQTIGDGEKLTSLNKGRAKAPTKRKPPSRHSLRAAGTMKTTPVVVEPIPNDDDRIVVGSEEKIEHIEEAPVPDVTILSRAPNPNTEVDRFVDRLSASVRNPAKRSVLPDGNENGAPPPSLVNSSHRADSKHPPKSKSIFGESDSDGAAGEDDDFFRKLPSVGVGATVKQQPPPPVQSQDTNENAKGRSVRSIFGTDDEDDADGDENDLFGKKKSTIAGQLKSSTQATKGRKSLFEDDDDGGDDDDDLFGSRPKTIPNVTVHHQSSKMANSRTSKPVTTTIRTVEDPLADLLADS